MGRTTICFEWGSAPAPPRGGWTERARSSCGQLCHPRHSSIRCGSPRCTGLSRRAKQMRPISRYTAEVQHIIKSSAAEVMTEMKDLLLQRRHEASTLTRDDIPSEQGLYVWYSTSSGEVLYVGKATGRAGLRKRIWSQHLNPMYLESRAEKFQSEDEFQRSCGVLVAGKVCVDKSVFRRSIGRSLRLAPGEDTVRYIRQNLAVAWLTIADLVGEIPRYEVELIRELKPKLNVSGVLKTLLV